ncbi:hypothetical protein [Peterkaempfera sp. SMS 1(5)a]|uniref:hypothetical protein n=1 Tax=Peterkaempfera podocarpi TaxID=3232308 RepID=UPI00366AD815
MNTAPHLRPDDRPDFERVLDEALRDETVRQALNTPAARLNAEQLRTKALAAAPVIAAAAADDYARYTALRDRIRTAAAGRQSERGEGPSLSAAAQLAAETRAGAIPALTVLAPILAWAAALIFLVLGYGLHTANPHLMFAHSLVTAGWVALAVGAVAMVAGIIGLLLTALRDGSAPPDGLDPRLYAELAHAREEWKAALKEHGMLPYLHSVLTADPVEPAVATAGAGVNLVRQRPRLGYTSPGFTSPGPERAPTGNGRSAFTSPDYSRPGFGSPDFTSPNYDGPDAPRS